MKKLFFGLFFLTHLINAQTPDATIKNNTNIWVRTAPLITGANEATLFDQLTNSKISRLEGYTASGTDAYTASVSWVTSYQNNLTLKINFTNANTGASTINITGASGALGIKAIKFHGSALTGGELNGASILSYNGTYFELIGGGGASLNGTGYAKFSGTTPSFIISIPNGDLANSSITIAGNSTSLGSSVTQDNITGLSSTGLIKRTGANTLAIASSGTDYQSAITFGTGVQTALGVNIGSAGAPVLFNGDAGMPSSINIANATGAPTWNQNTTGSAGSVANSLSISAELISGGSSSYNGSAAKSIAIQPSSVTNAMLAGSIAASKLVGTDIATLGTIISGTWNGTRLTSAYIPQGSALSVWGVTGNSTADQASIAAASDFQILRRSGTSVAFGSIDLSQSNAVGSSILPIANGGTGSSSFTGYLLASGGTATGTNTFAFGSNPWIVTTGVTAGTGATAGMQFVANSLTTGNGFDASSSSITTGSLAKFTSTSTEGDAFSIVNINSSGANANSTRTATGQTISVTNTGTSSTNVGLNVTASGGTNNYAGLFTGYIGIGNAAPTAILHITGSGSVPTLKTVGTGTGTNYSYRAFQSNGTTEIFSLADNGGFIHTTNTASLNSITGTWTATANQNYHLNFGGTFTTENVNSDVIYGYKFTPTLARHASNPAGQQGYGVFIGATASNSLSLVSALIQGGNTPGNAALQIGNSSFTGPLSIYQTANNSTTIDSGAGTVSIVMAPSGGNTIQLNATNTILGSAAFASSTGILGAPEVRGKQNATGNSLLLTGNFNGPIAGQTSVGVTIGGTFNGQTTSSGKLFSFDGASINLNANATNVTLYGIDYNPTLTNVVGLGTHYGLLVRPTASLSGFGLESTLPTARLELGGNMSAASWTTTGIQMSFDAATYTDTGSNGTRATAVAIGIAQPTFAATNTVTNTDAATLYIANSPAQGTGVTNTNMWSLWIDAGNTRFDGDLYGSSSSAKWGMFGTASVSQQSVLGILVNNVTSGGITSTIADFTDLSTYSIDAPTIRNNNYQLAKKLLAIETALRNYGILKD